VDDSGAVRSFAHRPGHCHDGSHFSTVSDVCELCSYASYRCLHRDAGALSEAASPTRKVHPLHQSAHGRRGMKSRLQAGKVVPRVR
jgi:hypothetical protein